MTWSLALAVALGGAIGAPMRYLIDSRISRTAQRRGYGFFPWGLLVVNVMGSLLIGLAYVSLGTLRTCPEPISTTVISAAHCLKIQSRACGGMQQKCTS